MLGLMRWSTVSERHMIDEDEGEDIYCQGLA